MFAQSTSNPNFKKHIHKLSQKVEEYKAAIRKAPDFKYTAPEVRIIKVFDHENHCVLSLMSGVEAAIKFHEERIKILEKMVSGESITRNEHKLLLQIPGLSDDSDIANYKNVCDMQNYYVV